VYCNLAPSPSITKTPRSKELEQDGIENERVALQSLSFALGKGANSPPTTSPDRKM
jgi:hypothetical protein